MEFYLKNGSIYAPLAKELYPSVLSGEEVGDDWLKERMELETDDQEILITEALEALKKICYPALTYDVDAYEPSLNAGDTIKIVDRKFHPTLTLEARATRQERSFTAPSKNKTKFDNYRALESKMPASLQSRYEELNELAKPYDLRLITSNGQTFKNGIGSSVITAEVWKNNKLFDATFQFKNVDTLISSGLTCLINANEIPETYVVTIDAYIGNEFIASKQLTFSNVNDGQDGIGINSTSVTYGISTSASVQPTNWTEIMPVATAEQYLWTRKITDYTDPSKPDTIELTYSYQGKNGAPGTSLTVSKTEYQAGTSGTVAPTGTWTIAIPTVADGQFLWMKATMSDNSTIIVPTKQGAKGKDGVSVTNNIPSYTLSTSGTTAPPTGWSSSIPTLIKGQFLWTKNDLTLSDSTTKTSYSVTYIPNDGINGQTPVVHTAYANSQNGAVDFSITDSTNKRYIGQYTDYTSSDSVDPTKYKWVDMVGSVSVGGKNLLLNSDFEVAENRTAFTVAGVTYSQGPRYWSTYNGGITNATTSYHSYLGKYGGRDNVVIFNESDGTRNWKAISFGLNDRMPQNTNDFVFSFDSYSTDMKTKIFGGIYYVNKSTGAFNFHAGQYTITPTNINTWERLSVKVPFDFSNCDYSKGISFYIYGYGFSSNAIHAIDKVQLENGNVSSNYDIAPTERQAILDAKIDTKADQLLTQQQILALEEKTTLERENAIAEAMQNTISEVEQKWQLWYDTNTKDEKQKVANDIASLMQRTAELDYKLGEASAKFSFINNETIIGEDGVAIGDKAGKAKLFMSGDSISFLTNGVAQMTLTGDTLSIKNGLFTERIQIGNFVEEVYDKNPLFNVIRAIKNS